VEAVAAFLALPWELIALGIMAAAIVGVAIACVVISGGPD